MIQVWLKEMSIYQETEKKILFPISLFLKLYILVFIMYLGQSVSDWLLCDQVTADVISF